MTTDMTITGAEQDTVFGGPTKRFFVEMLVRDIDLNDAILDLLDNCIDGAMRRKRGFLEESRPFEGFAARLDISGEGFRLSDDCGGIPEKFIEDAFRLGRPKVQQDGDLPTIGMYGIGMKRAIFKMAKSATVRSNSDEGYFEVAYDAEWLAPENENFHLEITREESKDGSAGVMVDVDDLKDEIARQFATETFVTQLVEEISSNFAYVMQRGFKIFVNDHDVKGKEIALYTAASGPAAGGGINAFDFSTRLNEVDVKVTIGLFRGLAKKEEQEKETDAPTEATNRAGVTVLCNDRVVLLSDRTMKTGWGDGSVPAYHPQFRAIAGLISFTCHNASKLPVSTTKRNLEAGSDVYLEARKAAMEGLKLFTDFTNRWKGMEDESRQLFENVEKSEVRREIDLARDHGSASRKDKNSRTFRPDLPRPDKPGSDPRARLSFLKKQSDVKTVSRFLFDGEIERGAIVGAACFDRVLGEARKAPEDAK